MDEYPDVDREAFHLAMKEVERRNSERADDIKVKECVLLSILDQYWGGQRSPEQLFTTPSDFTSSM